MVLSESVFGEGGGCEAEGVVRFVQKWTSKNEVEVNVKMEKLISHAKDPVHVHIGLHILLLHNHPGIFVAVSCT